MNVLLFGATGMVGQGALRECLLDPDVNSVLAIGRRATGHSDPRLAEIVQPDVSDLVAHEARVAACDACFFCLGVSSAGMGKHRYTTLTYDLTIAIARMLADAKPRMTFLYISGAGTDSSERGRVMWARVKGRTENELLRLPFAAAYMLRPGLIVPRHGIESTVRWTRLAYAATKPLHGAMLRLLPRHVTSTDRLGRVMIEIARNGYHDAVLETSDIDAVSRRLDAENRRTIDG